MDKNMKKVVCSFGDEPYYGSLKFLKSSCIKHGADEFFQYDQKWLMDTPFWKENLKILTQKRGAGYWIWKPYIILETFKNLDEGDIVLYSDAAIIVVNNLSPLWELADKNSIVTFRLGGGLYNDRTVKTWTKRDCLILLETDSENYHKETQTTGSYSLWKKDQKSIDFLNEWQKYLKDSRIVTDAPNTLGKNLEGFIEHRHDQSVLSLLTIKKGFERWRDPSQFGNEEAHFFHNSSYPQIFNHHRMKLFG